MAIQRWTDLKHKPSPEKRARIKQEAVAEYDHLGYAAVRKARAQTQVEMARILGISQASLSAIESRADLRLSTLARYIRALGGELEIRAVFPEATFNLDANPEAVPPTEAGTQRAAAKNLRARTDAVLPAKKPTARAITRGA